MSGRQASVGSQCEIGPRSRIARSAPKLARAPRGSWPSTTFRGAARVRGSRSRGAGSAGGDGASARGAELAPDDAACFRARRLDATAYRLLHPDEGPPRLAEARARYEAIDAETEVPFVAFRRALGRVSCAYREGAGRAPSSSAARPRSTPATEGWCVSA